MPEALTITFVVLAIYGLYWLFTQPPSDFPGGDGT